MPDEQLLQSGHWSAGSESSLCPAPFHSMMVGGCTRGEGQLFLVRLRH
ncbi:hypothetical protein [Phaeobacter sp. JH20_13]